MIRDNKFGVLLPETVDNSFPGKPIAWIVFFGLAIISTVRSLIHIFSPDGGAGSIAGINLAVDGAQGIIFAFALWGSAQLVYALIQLLISIRYRSLIPLMYLLLIIEVLLRMLIGAIKPVELLHTPPGAYGNYLVLPLAFMMLRQQLC